MTKADLTFELAAAHPLHSEARGIAFAMNRNLAPGLRIAKSAIDGDGCFAATHFRQHQRIAEYAGERISIAEAERRRRAPGKKFVCDVDSEWSIDGRYGGNGTQYINHSCEPNSYLVVSQGRVFLHALRKICSGEEITTEYFYELELDGTECRCQSASCVTAATREGANGGGISVNRTGCGSGL